MAANDVTVDEITNNIFLINQEQVAKLQNAQPYAPVISQEQLICLIINRKNRIMQQLAQAQVRIRFLLYQLDEHGNSVRFFRVLVINNNVENDVDTFRKFTIFQELLDKILELLNHNETSELKGIYYENRRLYCSSFKLCVRSIETTATS